MIMKEHLPIAAWILFLLLMLPQALVVDERMTYRESAFVPSDSEGMIGTALLAKIGYQAGDSIIVIFSPSDEETIRKVEEAALRSTKELGAIVVGPIALREKIKHEIRGAIARELAGAAEKQREIEELGILAKKKRNELGAALSLTYGMAQAYLTIYEGALRSGHPEPSRAAYEKLSKELSGTSLVLLTLFHSEFMSLQGLEPKNAAREALLRAVRILSLELCEIVRMFDFDNYDNLTKISIVIYEISGAKEKISADEFLRLLEAPTDVSKEIIMRRLEAVDPCLSSSFSRLLAGERPEVAALECEGLIERLSELPSDIKRSFISNGYAIVSILLPIEADVARGAEILREIEKSLKNITSESYYYGTIPFYVDLKERTISEIRRIDIATVILVMVLLTVITWSVSAPLVILGATAIALAVATGLLSIAALYFDIHYLSRALMIPIVFGITVDYSIFYLLRVAEERSKGLSWDEAVLVAWRRAGRALVLGGVSVVLGFLAYALTPIDAIRGIGIALTIASGTAFLSSYTLLPSLLLFLGERRALWPSKSIRMPLAGQSSVFRNIAKLSIRARIPVVITMMLVIIAGTMYLVERGVSGNVYLALTEDSTYVSSSKVLFENFPKDVFTKIYLLSLGNESVAVAKGLMERGHIVSFYSERVANYTVVAAGLPIDPLDDRIFDIVREVKSAAGSDVFVGGFPIVRSEVVTYITGEFFTLTLPLAIALILLYLMISMGSVLVPLRLLLTVIFSAVVSLLITLFIFDQIVGDDMYGSFVRSPIYWVTPITVLGIMLTLGMDYDIFITSRVREEMEVREEREAIEEAVEKTAVVITVCGIILAGAFSSLLFTNILMMRQAGLAIALSILIDTFIVRPILVPAIITIFGKYNWWPSRGLIRRWD